MSRKKRGSGRTLKQPSSLRLLLLTGIPGMGKTTIGDHLRDQHRFKHFNFENASTRLHYLQGDEHAIRQRFDLLKEQGRDVVITWGFVPDQQLQFVLLLRSLGFTWVWFDGDREAARREFLKRGDVPEALFDKQLARINAP